MTVQFDLFNSHEEKHLDLKDKTYVVFDTETTGLDTNSCKVIELGAVKIINGEIKEFFQTFVNPEMHIPDDASRVNNIYDDMVKDAPKFNEVLVDFLKFVDGKTLVAHNMSYDIAVMNSNARNYGYIFENELIDTLALARKKLPHLKRFKLETLCNHLKIDLTGAHRAVNDAVATAKVFLELTKNF